MPKTKIVCTIGPSSNSEEIIAEMIAAGMDVARLNFSHGIREDHTATLNMVRRVANEMGNPVAVMQDLQGPKIRTGPLKNGQPITLVRGSLVTITTEDLEGSDQLQLISTNYLNLPMDVRPGDPILLEDGRIELEVIEHITRGVKCRVVHGGLLGEYKGLNLPGVALDIPFLTDKDRADLETGLAAGVDYVAVSFVRDPADILQVKELIKAHGASTPVIAKVEKPEALSKLEAILEVTDGVMVARGDLGVELSPQRVPVWQKRIIVEANRRGVPVITATQMLESMVASPRPTRAEASDVANAILDGSDAIMLSGETAVGAYPVEAVKMMSSIARETEAYLHQHPRLPRASSTDYSQAIGKAACQLADEYEEVAAIVAFTMSGYTAALISRDRPRVPILAFTPFEAVCRRLTLLWGITPILCDYIEDVEVMVSKVEESLLAKKYVMLNESVVIVASLPLTSRGTTNFLRLHRIGGQS